MTILSTLSFVVMIMTSVEAHAHPQTLFAPFESAAGIQDRIEKFVGHDFYKPLSVLEPFVPLKASVKDQPWSGSYWPLYEGGPARPYAENKFTKKKLHDNYNSYEGRLRDIQKKIAKGKLSDRDLDNLSPTEKYDLYLGDTQFTLSQNVWQSLSESEQNRKKKEIKDWEGMCHGWAPASAYTPRPSHSFTLTSLDGRYSLNFYPDDVKALLTLLWANSLIQDDTLVEGLRCKTNFPERDQTSGKVTNTSCKGVNPGVLHLSILGLIGMKQSSFVINRDNDDQIWNQSVTGYQFHYYNLKTNASGNLLSSVVPIAQFDDPFRAFRSPKSAYLVGVDMTLNYASETDPSHQDVDSVSDDVIETLHMRYDLELDHYYNVIGGEYVNDDGDYGSNYSSIPTYPAFIWRFHSDNPYAASIVDSKLSTVTSSQFSSSLLLPLSQQASTFRYTRYAMSEDGDGDVAIHDEHGNSVVAGRELRPQPLAAVVNFFLKLARP